MAKNATPKLTRSNLATGVPARSTVPTLNADVSAFKNQAILGTTRGTEANADGTRETTAPMTAGPGYTPGGTL